LCILKIFWKNFSKIYLKDVVLTSDVNFFKFLSFFRRVFVVSYLLQQTKNRWFIEILISHFFGIFKVSRPETLDTETRGNGSRDSSQGRDQVSRLYHWCQCSKFKQKRCTNSRDVRNSTEGNLQIKCNNLQFRIVAKIFYVFSSKAVWHKWNTMEIKFLYAKCQSWPQLCKIIGKNKIFFLRGLKRCTAQNFWVVLPSLRLRREIVPNQHTRNV